MLFSLFWFQVWPEFWVWFQSPDTFAVAGAFNVRGKKRNTVEKNSARRNQICHMTFSSSKLKALALWHTDAKKCAHVHTFGCRHSVLSSLTQSICRHVHNNTQLLSLSACLPESHSPFPETILHCFLQSPNWLYPDPAHRLESETIKNSIYIPAVSTWAPTAGDYTHQPSSSVCDFKLQAVFSIYLNMAKLERFVHWTEKRSFWSHE